MTTVLQVIPSLGSGGAEQATLDIAAGLVAAGHRALVVSSGGRLVERIEACGAQHITMPVQSKNPWVMARNTQALAQLIRREDIDIIHARSRAPAWSALGASRLIGCHFMTTFHAAYKFNSAIKRFYNSVMARGDRVIAISDFIAQHIQSTYGVGEDRLRTIPRSLDLELFAPDKVTAARKNALRQAWGITAEERVILLPARLSPIKGHKVFLVALAQLPPTLPYTAVIVGDDQGRSAYRQELEAMIATLGLATRVRLVAHCADMPAAYSLAALVVAPSLVPEGFGRTPIEAMAMGVPVIASDSGGYRETIRPAASAQTYGWLFPTGDAVQLALAMHAALNLDAPARDDLTQRACMHVRHLYDRRVMVADTLAVYAELMVA